MKKVIAALYEEYAVEGSLDSSEIVQAISELYPDEELLIRAVYSLTSGQVSPSASLVIQVEDAIGHIGRGVDSEWYSPSDVAYDAILLALYVASKEVEE